MDFTYPLSIQYQWASLLLLGRPKFTVSNNNQHSLFYCEGPLYSFRTKLRLYNSEKEKKVLFRIEGKSMLSTSYSVYSERGTSKLIGTIRRHPFQSLLLATYSVFDTNGKKILHIQDVGFFSSTLEVRDAESKKVVMKYTLKDSTYYIPLISKLDPHLTGDRELLSVIGIITSVLLAPISTGL